MPVTVERLTAAEARSALDALATVLVDAVDGGDSVSFMAGLSLDEAREFYESLLPEIERGTRVLLAASVDGDLVGTVQLVHAWPPNSQHRADVAKLLVHRRARGHGVGRALMERLEDEARADGKSLLILDTVSDRAADRLYVRLGWTRLGAVPDYARDPDGSFCDATFFYKHL
ncbi:MAG TPA: GNAT family N-acetyltransferase [Gaiellaceae bacterium]|nr:GNAT family N-acetyltransferase [Gaiellaceae bacterium]